MILLTKDLFARLLANGIANRRADGLPLERGAIDCKPVVKLFTPDGNAIWLLTEIDPEDHDRAFGLCDLDFGCPELSHVSLAELGAVRGTLGLPVERDFYFTANKTLGAYTAEAMAHHRIIA